jgi:ferredoxin
MRGRKLDRRDFIKIFSADTVKGALGTNLDELDVIKMVRNFDVLVDEERCTLCEVCVRACPTSALTTYEEDDELILRFDQNLCDGCKLCEEKCPESSIKVVELEKQEVKIMAKASSKIVYCKNCGRPIGTEKGIRKVSDILRAKGLEEPAKKACLCPGCRLITDF